MEFATDARRDLVSLLEQVTKHFQIDFLHLSIAKPTEFSFPFNCSPLELPALKWDDKQVQSLEAYPLYITGDGGCLYCADRSVPLKELTAEERAALTKVDSEF